MVSCLFVNSFSPEYKRSNRSKHQKNLRCFPSCDPKGHAQHSFCGTSVVVEITDLPTVDGLFCAWAYFTYGEESMVGQRIQLKNIKKMEKSKLNVSGDYIRGHMINKSGEWSSEKNPVHMRIVFNESLLTWHYDWTSKYPTPNHILRILLCFNPNDDKDAVRVIEAFDSPSFKVLSKLPVVNGDQVASKKRKVTMVENPKQSMLATMGNKALEYLGYQPTPPINSSINVSLTECEKNRIYDRLFSLLTGLSSALGGTCRGHNNAFYPGSSNIENMNQRLSLILKANGFKDTVPVQNVLNRVLGELVGVSDNGSHLKSIIDDYSNEDGLFRFAQQCTEERLERFDWAPQHEDETYTENGVLVENTIYARFRKMFRHWIALALELSNVPVEYFKDFTEIFAKEGLLFLDPWYPPSRGQGEYLCHQGHIELNENLLAQYCVDAPFFFNKSQQEMFAKDTLLWRRAVHRRILADHLKERAFQTIDRSISEPLQKDFNGAWIDANAGCELGSQKMLGVTGFLQGELFSMVVKRMFSKISINMTSNILKVSGKPMMLGTGLATLLLDGVSHDFMSPFPVAMLTYLFSTREAKSYLAFFEHDAERSSLYLWYNPSLKIVKEAIQKFLPGYYKRVPAEEYVLYTRRRAYLKNKDVLSFETHDFLFPSSHNPLVDRDFVRHCAEKEATAKYIAVFYEPLYLRGFIGSNEEESLIDLLSYSESMNWTRTYDDETGVFSNYLSPEQVWQEYYNEEGYLYYYNPYTLETAWTINEQEHSMSMQENNISFDQEQPWICHLDIDSGSIYYVNPVSGESLWELPEGASSVNSEHYNVYLGHSNSNIQYDEPDYTCFLYGQTDKEIISGENHSGECIVLNNEEVELETYSRGDDIQNAVLNESSKAIENYPSSDIQILNSEYTGLNKGQTDEETINCRSNHTPDCIIQNDQEFELETPEMASNKASETADLVRNMMAISNEVLNETSETNGIVPEDGSEFQGVDISEILSEANGISGERNIIECSILQDTEKISEERILNEKISKSSSEERQLDESIPALSMEHQTANHSLFYVNNMHDELHDTTRRFQVLDNRIAVPKEENPSEDISSKVSKIPTSRENEVILPTVQIKRPNREHQEIVKYSPVISTPAISINLGSSFVEQQAKAVFKKIAGERRVLSKRELIYALFRHGDSLARCKKILKPQHYKNELRNVSKSNTITLENFVEYWKKQLPDKPPRKLVPYNERVKASSTNREFETIQIIISIPPDLSGKINSDHARVPYCHITRRKQCAWSMESWRIEYNARITHLKKKLESETESEKTRQSEFESKVQLEEEEQRRERIKKQYQICRENTNKLISQSTRKLGEYCIMGENENIDTAVHNLPSTKRIKFMAWQEEFKKSQEKELDRCMDQELSTYLKSKYKAAKEESLVRTQTKCQLVSLQDQIREFQNKFHDEEIDKMNIERSLCKLEDDEFIKMDRQRQSYANMCSKCFNRPLLCKLKYKKTLKEFGISNSSLHLVTIGLAGKAQVLQTLPMSAHESPFVIDRIQTFQAIDSKFLVNIQAAFAHGLQSWSQVFILRDFYPRGRIEQVLEFLYGDKNMIRLVDESQVLRWAEEMTRGLEGLHSNGIFHRSLTPKCIYLDQADHIKIGLPSEVASITHGVPVLLTPYSAPELVEDISDTDFKSADLWSMGIIIFEIVTGKVPSISKFKLSQLVLNPVLRRFQQWLRNFLRIVLQLHPRDRGTIKNVVEFFYDASDQVHLIKSEHGNIDQRI